MTDTIIKCAQCGSKMTQTGADSKKAIYHCSCCGNNITVAMTSDENVDYFVKKTELYSRTLKGIAEWKTTSWDVLRKDIGDFMARYEDARADMSFHMALLACMTNGFQYMTAEAYKECKAVYKVSEKLYKCTMRALKEKPDGKMIEQVSEYENNRSKYKKCRNEYRNTKIAWKIAFSVFKKIIFK